MISIDKTIYTDLYKRFQAICGTGFVFTDSEVLSNYERDQTFDLKHTFEILLKPGSPEEISSVLKLCNEFKIPVTPRGGGSGVTGGALPVYGGVVLSLERLNKIVNINKIDSYVIAESGVTTADLSEAVERLQLYIAVMPSSSKVSFIGGNVAENSGSIKSCKYGTTSNYIINMEVVLPNGDIIWTGANVLKNSTGLNLTQLFVGSEGILGIITKVVYKLLPKPAHHVTLLYAFKSLEDAFKAVLAIKTSTLNPSSVELIYGNALFSTARYLNKELPLLEDGIKAHLLISFEDTYTDCITHNIEMLISLSRQFTIYEPVIAKTDQERERLWELRMSIGKALTHGDKVYRDIDVCMPLSHLQGYLEMAGAICEKYCIPVGCFGHVLDGNMHVMLMFTKASKDDREIALAVQEIYSYAISKGGVISGEHGIGSLQKKFMSLQFSQPHLILFKNIKDAFDPNGILNPGKVI